EALGGRLDHDHPLGVELPGRGAGEVAAVLAEDVPDLAHGAVAVVGEGLHQHGDAAGAVALVEDLLEVAALATAECALDGTLDVVERDVVGLGRSQGVLQRQVDAGVTAAACAHGGLDGADVLADDLAALTVQHRLLALDLGPFAMSCQKRVLQPATQAAHRRAGTHSTSRPRSDGSRPPAAAARQRTTRLVSATSLTSWVLSSSSMAADHSASPRRPR